MNRHAERGSALIMAIFLITVLALLAGWSARMTLFAQDETINEWHSLQALYAAESGVQWAAQQLATGSGSGVTTQSSANASNTVWFTTRVSSSTYAGRTLYVIRSTGMAGASAAAPRVMRTIEAQFAP
ncbi:MAG: hypothetical protein OEZ16_01620 [Chromatiales bacterium]|nr:hypothetical protein [Chromatiales bacterium]